MPSADRFDGEPLTLLEYEMLEEPDDVRIELMRGRPAIHPCAMASGCGPADNAGIGSVRNPNPRRGA